MPPLLTHWFTTGQAGQLHAAGGGGDDVGAKALWCRGRAALWDTPRWRGEARSSPGSALRPSPLAELALGCPLQPDGGLPNRFLTVPFDAIPVLSMV